MQLNRLVWALTNKCNLRCEFCYASSSPDAEHGVSTDTALQFVKKINNSPIAHVSLIGGEPLLREDLEVIIRQFRPDITISIDTNGILIDKKWSDYLTKRIFQVSVGLDGPPEVNTLFREQTERVVSNVRTLINAGVRVAVPMMVNAKNYKNIDDAIKYVISLGVSKIKINKFVPVFGNENYNDLILSLDQELAAIASLKRIITENQNDLKNKIYFSGWYTPNFFKELGEFVPTRSSCYCGIWSLAVASDGSIVPCNVLTQKKVLTFFKDSTQYKILNISEENIFEKIQTNNLFVDVRKSVAGTIPPSCNTCPKIDNCTHGCRVYAFLKTNDWNGQFPFCNYF